MKIGTIGAGTVAQAFARYAIQQGHTVILSNRRGPASLVQVTKVLGSGATAAVKEEAAACGMVLLAVPWEQVVDALLPLPPWSNRILIDATNPFVRGDHGLTIKPMHGLSASQFVAELAPGARIVKALNNLHMERFEEGPLVSGARRVTFISGDEPEAKAEVGALLRSFGFADIDLGNLKEGGLIQQAGGPLAGLDILQK